MKISQDLPQFDKETLLIITGAQEAKIYRAFNGNLDIVEEIRISMPDFDDKGGQFKLGGRTVAAQEFDKNELTDDMLKKVEGVVKNIKIQDVYLVSPSHVMPKLKEVLPKSLNIMGTISGNYCNNHEFDVLKKIKEII